MTKGQKTPKSIILVHGFTNCPKQFQELGKRYRDIGYNVYIPRLSYHGLKDKMNSELEKLTYQDLIKDSKEMLEVATALGDEVEVVGISGGGIIAGWVGVNSPKVTRIQSISPMYSPTEYDIGVMNFGSNILAFIPNEYKWWDDNLKEKSNQGTTHAYPRYSSKAGNAFFRIGNSTVNQLSSKSVNVNQPPKSFFLLTTDGDSAVNNGSAKVVHSLIKTNLGSQTNKYELSSKWKLNHDIIDPLQPKANIDLVYPIIINNSQSQPTQSVIPTTLPISYSSSQSNSSADQPSKK
jgi:esterase/lipase